MGRAELCVNHPGLPRKTFAPVCRTSMIWALTYFLWERVVQDLIECTHNVCFRDDWGEESRAEAVQLLDVILAENRGHIDAAYQASAHLPRDLTVHSRKST